MTADELLQERARELARPLDDEGATRNTTTLLRFRYAGEAYALEIADARQTVQLSGAARLPDDAWPLVAVGLVGGDIVPVVELSTAGGRRAGRALPEQGVAVEADGMVLIVPADEVHGVVEVSDADVSDVPAESAAGSVFVRGVTRQGDGLLDVRVLLDTVKNQRSDEPGGLGPPQEGTDR